MKLLVLGATGATGRLIVAQERSRGHDVVALVRSAGKAGGLDATLVEGDARDGAALASALHGCDAVVSALGTPMSPFRKVTLLSEATRSLIVAMQRRGVERLVCITGLGAGDSRGHGGFVFDRLVLPLLLRRVYQDKDRQEALVRNSGLAWVLVRPVVLNDEPDRGDIEATTDLGGVHGGKISRADVANFVLDQLDSDRWLHRSPLIRWRE